MTVYAELADVELELERTLGDARAARVAVLLDQASRLIDQQPGVTTRYASGDLDPAILKMIAVSMVVRVLRSPAGVKSETVGPKSVVYDTAAPEGMYITDAELAWLGDASQTDLPAQSRSVRMARPAWWRG